MQSFDNFKRFSIHEGLLETHRFGNRRLCRCSTLYIVCISFNVAPAHNYTRNVKQGLTASRWCNAMVWLLRCEWIRTVVVGWRVAIAIWELFYRPNECLFWIGYIKIRMEGLSIGECFCKILNTIFVSEKWHEWVVFISSFTSIWWDFNTYIYLYNKEQCWPANAMYTTSFVQWWESHATYVYYTCASLCIYRMLQDDLVGLVCDWCTPSPLNKIGGIVVCSECA